jgi:hypothetical protein
MSEPLRTDPADLRHRHEGSGGADGPLNEADRAARIEELLLAGLDQYFGGHYEQAINIWTRVAFLERGHGRARAYIERARDALAEKQRESEELVHTGVSAYHAGELDKARDLLTRAVDAGGANETALVFLQRLSRARLAANLAQRPAGSKGRRRRYEQRRVRGERPEGGWLLSIGACVAVSGMIVFAALALRSWLVELPVAAPVAESAIREPLPIVRGSDMRLARARELYSKGRSHEALRLLADVDVADPLRAQADQLTADIQRGLLGLVPPEPTATHAGETAR